jgi:hypothetical protein
MRSLTTGAKAWLLFALFSLVTVAIYSPGLNGAFLFDDYPNIVDNPGVKPHDASLPTLVRVALSSPSSEFKRPLASLSFGANYLITGSDPYWMKTTNLAIHLLNGWLVFLIARIILRTLRERIDASEASRGDVTAALVAGAWLILPINLTAVLYVVQRMESLANLFILAGLLMYIVVRRRMQSDPRRGWLVAAAGSLIVPTAFGVLAKETAVMLPMYGFVVELALFHHRSAKRTPEPATGDDRPLRVIYLLALWLPMVIGLAWLLPGLLRPSGWSTRNFVMSTRLLTEARVVMDYISWIVIPTPEALSFYHDDIVVSRSLIAPWTTLPSLAGIVGLFVLAWISRRRVPLVTLGLGLFITSQLLTGTILPLELVYEHRNYFASFGLLLAIIPLLAQADLFAPVLAERMRTSILGPAALIALLLLWTGLTAITAYSWGSPVRLARELAARAPESPRAQYELGRTYVIMTAYDPQSPFTQLLYAPLERSAALPGSSILPEQALIFFNARMNRPLEDRWWKSMEDKLRSNKVTVQDESALGALTDCMRRGLCDLPRDKMLAELIAAIDHPAKSARLLAIYADFAWNSLDDRQLSVRMAREARQAAPAEPAYAIALVDKLAASGNIQDARIELQRVKAMNIGGSLNADVARLDSVLTPH